MTHFFTLILACESETDSGRCYSSSQLELLVHGRGLGSERGPRAFDEVVLTRLGALQIEGARREEPRAPGR
jgi:hypothetical protein